MDTFDGLPDDREERLRATREDSYLRNRDKRLEYQRRYYQQHKEELNARQRLRRAGQRAREERLRTETRVQVARARAWEKEHATRHGPDGCWYCEMGINERNFRFSTKQLLDAVPKRPVSRRGRPRVVRD